MKAAYGICLAMLAAACGGGTTLEGDGESCAEFIPSGDLGPPVTIEIRNDTDGDLYLGDQPSCEPVRPYALWDDHPGGDSTSPKPLQHALSGCDRTCEQLQTEDCSCYLNCMAPHVIRIAAGGSHVSTWAGYVYIMDVMPAACFFSKGCGNDCLREGAPPDVVRVAATAHPSVSCTGSPDCTCDPDANGSCTMWNVTLGATGTPVEADAEWHTGESSATMVFAP